MTLHDLAELAGVSLDEISAAPLNHPHDFAYHLGIDDLAVAEDLYAAAVATAQADIDGSL